MFDWSMRRWVGTGILSGLALFALALAIGWLFRSSLLSHVLANGFKTSTNSRGAQVLVVPDNRIPKSGLAAAGAPALSLLPSHWESGSNSDGVLVPDRERSAIGAALQVFLPRWETFKAGSWLSYKSWQSSLRPLVSATNVNVLDRSESTDIEQICPHPPCTVSQTWFAGYPHDGSFALRADDGSTAFVTAYGLVRLHDPRGEVDGKTTVREYGLVLRKHNGRWLVDRAVAESVR
jgi:hypothetical protein